MTKRTTKHAKKAVADSASGLQHVIDSAEDLLESLRDQQGEAVDHLRARISTTIQNARDRIGELDVPELASEAVDSTLGFVRRDPWRSVAIGALAALAVTLVMRSGYRS
jgi:ElaB/YqjD/DUF883 family membrane-anchored ribosome-binding protein